MHLLNKNITSIYYSNPDTESSFHFYNTILHRKLCSYRV